MAEKKKILHRPKLLLMGGAATPGPPVSPTVSSKGVKAVEFCNIFNKLTQDQKGKKLRVKVLVYEKSYEVIVKGMRTSELLMTAAGLKKGSSVPNRDKVGTVSRADLEEIAKSKNAEINGASLEAAVRSLTGTARSMGITVA